MKDHRLPAVILCLCLLAAAGVRANPPAAGVAEAQADTSVPAVGALWAQLWNARQLDSLVALYADDAVLLSAEGGRFVGRTAIRHYYAGKLAARPAGLHLRSLASRSLGELAYDSGAYEETAGGSAHGYFLAVLQRQPEGQWLISQQMWNAAPVPAAALAAPLASPAPPAAAAPSPPGAAAAPPVPAAALPAAENPMADVSINSAPPAAAARKPYDDTGCDRGLFKGPAPARWMEPKAWAQLRVGMSQAQVESTIGADHYDEVEKGHLRWEYGRCGRTLEGVVVFDQDQVSGWNAPDR